MPAAKKTLLRILMIGTAVLPLAVACTTVPASEADATGSMSVISGDLKLRFSSPVNVYLRKVDDTRLGVFENSARVTPGPHELLVDCSAGNTEGPSRFVLSLTTVAGVDYRLQAVLAGGKGGCTGVEIIETRR
ncbi:MAG: hypothetical protein O6931_09605 [Gammaproteobacteria bacterium]|nr:hypothetical protein [Gammaproteobacteria bacterium]